jgi:hypothetical protein
MPKIDLSDWPPYSSPDLAGREGSITAKKIL